MTKTLLLALGLGLALAGPASLAAPAPRPTTEALADMVTMDLNKFGVPLSLQVPAGTTARARVESWGSTTIMLEGPRFRVGVVTLDPPAYTADKQIDSEISSLDESDVMVVREPTMYRSSSKTEGGQDSFGVAIYNPATKRCYSLRVQSTLDTTFTPDEVSAMFASARTAKLVAAAPAAAKAPTKTTTTTVKKTVR